ncbi:MAG: superoxide dismutase [Candidatus Peregrinibacteria bacterium]
MNKKPYTLPALPYDFNALEPYISAQQLQIHHDKHHQGYVNGANAVFEKLETARKEGAELDMKSVLKNLSFNVGGHILHSLFWANMAPAGNGGGGEPQGALAESITTEFGSFARFKTEFSAAAASVEGSGWAALFLDKMTNRPVIMQIEKHNVNIAPGLPLLLVIDVWEHAYYLDYKNERGKFIEAFWNIVNWEEVGKSLELHG